MSPAASHVLMIEPVQFRANAETSATNAFQHAALDEDVARKALMQHRGFRDRLIESGVTVTVARGDAAAPDAPFCNNWFSTHASGKLVLYPMLAENRRIERRQDLVDRLRARYPEVVDLSAHEKSGRFLEGTGSLCIDAANGVAYAALSPRTEKALAQGLCATLGLRLVAFTATDAGGVPYYHTNVMMFVGHGLAAVCAEAITADAEREAVLDSLAKAGHEVLLLTREQVAAYCGNVLALRSDRDECLWAMSSTAAAAFTRAQREALERRARIVDAPLDAFEQAGGGSARCLLAELL
ncbi:MAG: amidinotransferase [Planctomycetes bacterium]|nr:amidinotransferase [Planctomycetota bacterium]